jgi:hypothetical protein
MVTVVLDRGRVGAYVRGGEGSYTNGRAMDEGAALGAFGNGRAAVIPPIGLALIRWGFWALRGVDGPLGAR